MTRICVAGGTGQVGQEVVYQAIAQGHAVSVLSRNPPPSGTPGHHGGASYFRADVTTGEGLAAALAGAVVVIDCLEGQSGKALKNYADGGTRLLAAAEKAGVSKAVALSIINCDQSSAGFYRSEADKERAYSKAALETVTVRATQFHSLVGKLFSAASRVRLIPVIKGARFQTIAPGDVSAALLEAATEGPSSEQHRLRTIGGPEVMEMRELAEIWKRATGSKGLVIEFPLPGAMGTYLREGRNLIPEQRYGTETFEGWLAKRTDSL
ncbi:SDR family oxidoreductase [Pseudarthrobacter sp. N5]|uniref:SDR family oxidoreductase n=1 Tax=Pseudarthrobacter sp. N5 TaxID=3418416 RepID=UPI003CF15D2E